MTEPSSHYKDYHFGLPVVDLCGSEYAIAFDEETANLAMIKCIKDAYWVYVPSYVQECLFLPEEVIKLFHDHEEVGLADFFDKTTVGQLFAMNSIAKSGRGGMSSFDDKEIRFNQLTTDQQKLFLELEGEKARGAYLYRVGVDYAD
jgi:hypothetical protein